MGKVGKGTYFNMGTVGKRSDGHILERNGGEGRSEEHTLKRNGGEWRSEEHTQ